ncbi:hypothetical protein [Streptococcus dentiloxodontae]
MTVLHIVIIGLLIFSLFKIISFVFIMRAMKPSEEKIAQSKERQAETSNKQDKIQELEDRLEDDSLF